MTKLRKFNKTVEVSYDENHMKKIDVRPDINNWNDGTVSVHGLSVGRSGDPLLLIFCSIILGWFMEHNQYNYTSTHYAYVEASRPNKEWFEQYQGPKPWLDELERFYNE